MQCLSKIIKPGIDTEENSSEWLPDQFPELKTSERFLIALLSEQDEVLQKLSSMGYQDQKHWVCMIWRFFLRGVKFEKIGSYLSRESPDQFA